MTQGCHKHAMSMLRSRCCDLQNRRRYRRSAGLARATASQLPSTVVVMLMHPRTARTFMPLPSRSGIWSISSRPVKPRVRAASALDSILRGRPASLLLLWLLPSSSLTASWVFSKPRASKTLACAPVNVVSGFTMASMRVLLPRPSLRVTPCSQTQSNIVYCVGHEVIRAGVVSGLLVASWACRHTANTRQSRQRKKENTTGQTMQQRPGQALFTPAPHLHHDAHSALVRMLALKGLLG